MLSVLLDKYAVVEIHQVNIREKEKIGNYSLNSFPIYVINLKDNKERRHYIFQLFKKHRLNYTMIVVERFKYTTNEELIALRIAPSKLGCILSHLWCIKDAISKEHSKFVVMEDDVIFHKQFHAMFEKMMKEKNGLNDMDLLMLGSLDRNIHKHLETHPAGETIYFPRENVLGAHANLYGLNFAKTLLETKLNAPKVLEFDYDYHRWMKDFQIGVCIPNLVVCELSTTNINHHFSPMSVAGFESGRKFFESSFTYLDYEYILITFIQFIVKGTGGPYKTMEDMLVQFKLANKRCMNIDYIIECIAQSGYVFGDMHALVRSIKHSTL